MACSALRELAELPRVAITADPIAALVLEADIGLRLPYVLRHTHLHLTAVYSAAQAAEVLMVRSGGWTQLRSGSVFKRVLELYRQQFRPQLRLTYLEEDRGDSAWLPESELASRFRAAVFVPDCLNKFAAREYYAMGIPLFVVEDIFL